MKIAKINSSDIGGGAEKVGNQIFNELNSRNVECTLYVRDKKTDIELVKSIQRSTVDKVISKISNVYISNGDTSFLEGSRKMVKQIIEEQQLVHLHNIHGNFFNINNVKELYNNMPIVWTLHDMWAFTGKCVYSYECDGWLNKCGKCNKRISEYPPIKFDNSRKLLERKVNIFNNENIFYVTPSLWLEKLFKTSHLKNCSVITINNGVDLNTYKKNDKKLMRKKYNLSVEGRYILFIAANVQDERKGIKYLLKVLNEIKDKNKYTLLIVGKQIDLKIIDKQYKVIHFGYIRDENKLNEIYSLADIFIMPSLADNFPCTIIEAMASGTPTMAFNVGGISEQIDEKVGWLNNEKEIDGMVKVLNNIWNGEQLDKYSFNCREKAKTYYDLEQCVDKYINLYEYMLKKYKKENN